MTRLEGPRFHLSAVMKKNKEFVGDSHGAHEPAGATGGGRTYYNLKPIITFNIPKDWKYVIVEISNGPQS